MGGAIRFHDGADVLARKGQRPRYAAEVLLEGKATEAARVEKPPRPALVPAIGSRPGRLLPLMGDEPARIPSAPVAMSFISHYKYALPFVQESFLSIRLANPLAN